MIARIPRETHKELVRRMNTERIELRAEIQRGNYRRAANIANYISEELMKYAALFGEVKP